VQFKNWPENSCKCDPKHIIMTIKLNIMKYTRKSESPGGNEGVKLA